MYVCFCFQAEDGIRDLVRSRGLGDVYKRQRLGRGRPKISNSTFSDWENIFFENIPAYLEKINSCLLYTSDAADERSSVDLGGRRIIKKKTNIATDGSETTKADERYLESLLRHQLTHTPKHDR